ncbi:alpha/beta hydrolase [Phreatobacter aquaticus]|uniref:Alpha/beta hydrolase n=1 Tax=Phreatobacter aquaticus TaxID=2570229 RepID=A0A4D7QQ72_9HYPH|nr:alpha/beta hydrolase [Phreatobacter aquaticus]QCK87424.1 alpha/beta hydrolase [Phreatobacter aquaticus]
MTRAIARAAIGLVMMLTGMSGLAHACSAPSCANGLAYQAYGPAQARTLAVFVHGDVSSGGPADYMYRYAQSFAAGRRDVAAVALLRPGYYDRVGNRSAGSDGGRRDTFDAGSIRTIAGAIRELKAKYGAQRVIALGHSGGAGVLGVIAGNSGGLLNGVVLASCPCDVQAWRASRGSGRGFSSLSPVDYISGVPSSTAIVAVTGAGDTNTRPALAEDYVARARAAGRNARVEIVAGGHGFGSVAGPSVRALTGMAR